MFEVKTIWGFIFQRTCKLWAILRHTSANDGRNLQKPFLRNSEKITTKFLSSFLSNASRIENDDREFSFWAPKEDKVASIVDVRIVKKRKPFIFFAVPWKCCPKCEVERNVHNVLILEINFDDSSLNLSDWNLLSYNFAISNSAILCEFVD